MFRFLFFLSFFVSHFFYGQNSVNNYKYVLVPESYEFLASEDKYQLNSLTNFLFNKHGFKSFIRGKDLPEDLGENICNALLAKVEKKSALLVTKLLITLKNCKGEDIFTSSIGVSREKDYKTAYHEALRNAFKSVIQLNYKYKGSSTELPKEDPKRIPSKKNDDVVVKKGGSQKTNNQISKNNPISVNSSESLYTFNERSFTLKKEKYGYELFEVKNGEHIPSGKIYALSRQNNYLINAAAELDGSGYFDSYGNFVLERVNPATSKIIKDVFARQ